MDKSEDLSEKGKIIEKDHEIENITNHSKHTHIQQSVPTGN